MVTWRVDFDPTVWLPVPDLSDDADGATWLEQASDAVATDFAESGDLRADYRDGLRQQLRDLLKLAHEYRNVLGNMLAHLPGPADYPAPVWMDFRMPRQDDPEYLLDLVGARGAESAQPPTVDHVETPALGEGVRVLRYSRDEHGALIGNLCYAWRASDVDVLVRAQTHDLGRLVRLAPDLDTLVGAIRPA